MITFGDAENAVDIPTQYAALYSRDCDHPCSPADARKWSPSHRRWISFTGETSCSIVDWEQLTKIYNDPTLLHHWIARRALMMRSAIIYSDRANVAKAITAIGHLQRHAWWWIATLDGVPQTAESLSAELRDKYGADVPARAIWGQQVIDHGSWDESHLLMERFHV